jgi:hypothetical protein
VIQLVKILFILFLLLSTASLTTSKDEKLIPDSNQEPRTGYIFRLALYEGNELKLNFIPNSINEIQYKTNDDLTRKLKELFTMKFNKKF